MARRGLAFKRKGGRTLADPAPCKETPDYLTSFGPPVGTASFSCMTPRRRATSV